MNDLSVLGGIDTGTAARKQRIGKQGAQLLERVAYGGLRNHEYLGGTGHRSLAHQHGKDHQQIQVHIVEGLWVHVIDMHISAQIHADLVYLGKRHRGQPQLQAARACANMPA